MNNDNDKNLRNLSVIGSLAQNDKLNTKDDIFVIYVPTTLRGIARFYYGENRQQNLQRIQQCIRDSKHFISTCMNDINNNNGDTHSFIKMMDLSEQKTFCARMLDALKSSKKGLECLQLTYKDDATATSSLSMLVNEIDDFLHATRQLAETSPPLERFKLHE